MRVVKIANTNGLDNLKLEAENANEAAYLRQLAGAGMLTVTSNVNSNSVVFSAASFTQSYNTNVISRGTIGKCNFKVRQNQDFELPMSFFRNKEKIDLSLYDSIKMAIKPEYNFPTLLTLELSNGLSVLGENNNVLNISISKDKTSLLCRPNYYYDICFQITTDDHTINQYYVEGMITVEKSITTTL